MSCELWDEKLLDKMLENGNDYEEEGDDNVGICRDYLRNVCRRGQRCKFRHPSENEQESLGLTKFDVTFCHDYQNKQCSRTNCKFIHCTREEEHFYMQTGELPPHVREAAIRKGIAPDLGKGEIPVCKDFLKGECRRGGKCKFQHVSTSEYEMKLYGTDSGSWERFDYDHFNSYDIHGAPEAKRRHCDSYAPLPPPRDYERRPPMALPEAHRAEVRMLEDENMMLKRKIEELKRQVFDLNATNEFLLDQNAQMRHSKHTAVTPASMPAISIANTMPVVSTVQITPVAQISAQLPITSDLNVVAAGQTSLSQQVPGPTAQVVGSVTSLGNIATVATVPRAQGPPALAAPVTLAAVSMAQALPRPTASIAQTLPPIPMSISSASGQLITYPPIVTQGVRSSIQNASLPH